MFAIIVDSNTLAEKAIAMPSMLAASGEKSKKFIPSQNVPATSRPTASIAENNLMATSRWSLLKLSKRIPRYYGL
jgi:hypothetical protein